MTSRIDRVRAGMQEAGLPALLVTRAENIFYLSGFFCADAALLITGDQQWVVTDFRYFLQAEQEASECALYPMTPGNALAATLRQLITEAGVPLVGYDPDAVTVSLYHQLGGEEADVLYRLQAAPGMVEALRMTKEPDEVACIREAARITDAAMAHVLALVRPGITEAELALEAEWAMRREGADKVAFDIIVAAGPHCAQPHAVPCSTILQSGDLVIFDMGAQYRHYCADLTRTVAVAEASPRAREIYARCLEAQLAGLAGIHAGMIGKEADGLVREVITRAGFGDYFGHGTGHGVGLEIHENPRLNQRYEGILPAGAVVTVEPGIYLPEFGGVRIEDLVLLSDQGLEILSTAPKPVELPIYG